MTKEKKYDVFGIGNPLMDLLVRVNHNEILDMDLQKGNAHLLTEDELVSIEDKIKHKKPELSPGGSVANTLAGVANLGGSAVFCGKVGEDEHGVIYEEKLAGGNVHSRIVRMQGLTGKAITFITPDSERTFAVNLGVSLNLRKQEVMEEDIKQSRYFYVSGFELEDESMRETVLHAMDIAKKNNVKIAIDLADPSLIKRSYKDLSSIVKKYADIILANEEEAKAFTQKQGKEALNALAEYAPFVAMKLGKKGSLLMVDGKTYTIDASTANAVDTTGAGDIYAAGILYGLSKGLDIEKTGKLASYISARVVEKMGARIDIPSHEIEKILK